MKKIITVFVTIHLLIFSINSSIAQTKKETEDWILYYMRKNFSRDNKGTITGKYDYHLTQNNEAYFLRQYKFSGNKLIVDMQLNEFTGKEIVDETTTIDLIKIIKVEKNEKFQALKNEKEKMIFEILTPDQQSLYNKLQEKKKVDPNEIKKEAHQEKKLSALPDN